MSPLAPGCEAGRTLLELTEGFAELMTTGARRATRDRIDEAQGMSDDAWRDWPAIQTLTTLRMAPADIFVGNRR